MFATEIGSMIGFAWVMSWLAVIAFVGRASTGTDRVGGSNKSFHANSRAGR